MTPNRDTLLSSSGPSPSTTTARAQPLIGNLSPIRRLQEGEHILDAPNNLRFATTQLNDTRPLSVSGRSFDLHGGIARSMEDARNAAIGEAIERYCLSIVGEDDLTRGAADESSRVDPSRFHNHPGELNDETEYYWTPVRDIHNDREVSVPAQFVYCPVDAAERYIRNPITTGAAAHCSYRAAIKAGLLEVIEREAFMINYLHKLPNRRIPQSVIEQTPAADIVSNLESSKLKTHFIKMTLDLPVHIVLCICWDEALGFPTVGMDAGFEFGETIEDALLEAYHAHPWQRRIDAINHNIEDIINIRTRAEFWKAKKNDTRGIEHWLEADSGQFQQDATVETVMQLIETLEDRDIDIYVRDLTTENIKDQGFRAVRVISPEIHPLYLDERFKYTVGNRLYEVPEALGFDVASAANTELNPVPHPFL